VGNDRQAQDYFDAASSKCECAREVFLPALLEALQRAPGEPSSPRHAARQLAPIQVRAFFDAMLWSANAAREQFKAALARRLGVRVEASGSQVIAALRRSDREGARELEEWWRDPFVQDAKQVRDSATHRFYTKSPDSSERWAVDPPDGGATYGGSRELAAYGARLLDATVRLEEIMNRVWGKLNAPR
jgi:hypothetical protein